jgi:tetratricopeptide (TPR) repeat protein
MSARHLSMSFLICVGFSGLVYASNYPADLQQRGIERIERFREHFRKTGDYTSLVSELLQAQKELRESYNAFIDNGANASAALNLIKLGDVHRLQDEWQEAEKYYQQGYDLAKRADHVEYQARARLGQSQAEKGSLEEAQRKGALSHPRYEKPKVDYSQALKHAQEAVLLTRKLDDKGLLYDVLEAQATTETKSGDLDAAMSTLNLAFATAQALGDKKRLLDGYLYRADINYNRVHDCAQMKYQGSYQPCYEAVDQARSDYEQALALAKNLEYAGLATYMEDFLGDVEKQRCMVILQECDRTSFRNVKRDLPYTEPTECCRKCPQVVLRDIQKDEPKLFKRVCGESPQ